MKTRSFFLFFSFLWWVALPVCAAFQVPRLSGPVVDQAGLIQPSDERILRQLIQNFHQSGKGQIQVLTVPTLEDLPIEQASIQVVDQWKLGDAKTDNGILLMVAAKERRIRIEVGQGLEGVIPDVMAKRIIDDVMAPVFRNQGPSKGILIGVDRVIEIIAPELVTPIEQQSFQKKSKGRTLFNLPSFVWIILLLILIKVLSRFGGGGGGSGMRGRGPWVGGYGGGFGGGGFGGGGGWSGGGGGFSGGGSSGSW